MMLRPAFPYVPSAGEGLKQLVLNHCVRVFGAPSFGLQMTSGRGLELPELEGSVDIVGVSQLPVCADQIPTVFQPPINAFTRCPAFCPHARPRPKGSSYS